MCTSCRLAFAIVGSSKIAEAHLKRNILCASDHLFFRAALCFFSLSGPDSFTKSRSNSCSSAEIAQQDNVASPLTHFLIPKSNKYTTGC